MTLFPYTTLFRSHRQHPIGDGGELKVGIHRGADAPQLAATFKQL
jgi:hypothetical protein